jgi:DNA-binding MarR family transcriptional regulator
VSTSADAQRAIAALEQSNGSLYETTLVHRLGLTRACVGSVVDELADIGVVTVRRGQGDNQIVLNPMRLSEVREQEAQDA